MPINDKLHKQLINDLLVESSDGLQTFDSHILALEKGEGTPETPNIIFRVIHTIKGTAGCLGLSKIESVAHVGENLLSGLREGKIAVTPPLVAALLAYADALRQMLRALETTGSEGDADYSALLKQLQDLQTAPPSAAGAATKTSSSVSGEQSAAPSAHATPTAQPEVAAAHPGWGLFEDDPEPAAKSVAPKAETPVPTPAPTPAPAPSASAAASPPSAADSAIRVNVDQLDKLMNLVGELVLARNQIVQYCASAQEGGLVAASQRLNIITTELQEGVMKTRMQPIGNVWAKFPRIVRDVAHELGKQVELVMEGQQTELDRTIIEAIKDPLTHIVRNAIDHGIEQPEVRDKSGKPATGSLLLRAFHEGGQVNIEIVDDGRGIPVARVKQKAVENGLVTAEHAARMSDREAFNLIFLPGFSTAEKVTNVSGRGVGMDVVKTNIEKIGGSVDVLSESGCGTTIKIKIPLTLAIIPALIVSSGGERFAIPQVSLLELVRLESRQAAQGIEMLYGAPVYRLRGRLLPLLFLKRELKIENLPKTAARTSADPHGATPFDFGLARERHQSWCDQLRRFLNGQSTVAQLDADEHATCALGTWLRSEGLQEHGHFQEFKSLEKKHTEFHALAKHAVEAKLAGNSKDAEHTFLDVQKASDAMIELLATVEQLVQQHRDVNIVVLQADGRQFGLVVDEINDTEEIVVKPLSKQLKGISCFAGATIMGDGRVALILDVLGLAQHANVVSEVRDRALADKSKTENSKNSRQTLLLFEASKGNRMAIPLSMVARLEEFSRQQVERSGAQEVVQYRGQILPLVRVSNHVASAGETGREPHDPMQVVVYSEQGRSVGLVVGHISDIVEEVVTVKRDAAAAGILGSVVIQDKVTDLLDVPTVIRAADPSFFEEKTQPASA